MSVSKLDRRGRTTLPATVREALGLAPGDVVVYSVQAGRVILSRMPPTYDPFGTFSEWDSEADRIAYSAL